MKFFIIICSLILVAGEDGMKYERCFKGGVPGKRGPAPPLLIIDNVDLKIECSEAGCDKGMKLTARFEAKYNELPESLTVSCGGPNSPDSAFSPVCFPFNMCKDNILIFEGVVTTPLTQGELKVDLTVKDDRMPMKERIRCIRFFIPLKEGLNLSDKPKV